MKMSQLKTLIIVVLVIANLFLLSLVVPAQVMRARQRTEVKQSIASLLEKSGISIDEKSIPDDFDIAPLDILRNTKAQQIAARALLGECEAEDMGGGITRYSSSSGSAIFRTGGEFAVTLETKSDFTSPKHASKLFRAMGITVDKSSIKTVNAEDKVTVYTYQSLEGAVMFDCPVTATFGAEGLESVEGRWITQTQRSSALKTGPCGSASAMTAFLDAVKREGIICASVEELTQGYIISQTSSSSSLIPAWRIKTDTGIYMFNSSTGDIFLSV